MAKKYEELEFTDNFMFVKVLSENPDLCKELLELILQKQISRLRYITYEKTTFAGFEAKGIRMDIVTSDDDNNTYDVEMQLQNKKNLPKRSRYYHAVNDVDQLLQGDDYNRLTGSYVIFICKNRPSPGYDRPIYTFRYQCQEDGNILLNDDTCTVFVNADCAYENMPGELISFLEYIKYGKVNSGEHGLAAKIEKEVVAARLREEWGAEYMKWEQELHYKYLEGKEEGIEQGIKQGASQLVCRLISDGKLTMDQGAEYLGVSTEALVGIMSQIGTDSD